MINVFTLVWFMSVAINLGYTIGKIHTKLSNNEQLSLETLIINVVFSTVLAPVATFYLIDTTIDEALNMKGRIFKSPSGLNIRN